ncbi:MAK10-like protein [Tanacetum coccineum]
MGEENPICTLGNYSKPSHEGYGNTIALPKGTMWCLFDPTPSGWKRTCRRLFQFSLRDQASNWLKRLLAGSISTWEDLTTRFLVQFSVGKNCKTSWNDPRDFAKPVKAISLPQDVSSTSDRRLVELENQVQRLMEAHFAPKKVVQVNKITSSCEICSGPHDIQYCMENPEQAFVDYASSRNNEFDSHQERRLSSLGAQLRRQQDDMINKINILWKVFSEKLDDTSTHDTAGDSMAHVNASSTDQIEKEELRRKGIKIPSKLLSPKYLSQVSLKEQNRNLSSPKRVHFINSVFILRKGDEVREKENVNPNATEYNDHEMTAKAEEKFEEESEYEFEEEIGEEEEEEEEDVIFDEKKLGSS